MIDREVLSSGYQTLCRTSRALATHGRGHARSCARPLTPAVEEDVCSLSLSSEAKYLAEGRIVREVREFRPGPWRSAHVSVQLALLDGEGRGVDATRSSLRRSTCEGSVHPW